MASGRMRERLYTAENGFRIFLPVQQGILFLYLRRINRKAVLRDGRNPFFFKSIQRFFKQGQREQNKSVPQFVPGLETAYAQFFRCDDRSGIQSLVHPENRHARFLQSREYGPLDGRGSAQVREKRKMDVDHSRSKEAQQNTGNDSAETHHYTQIGFNIPDLGEKLFFRETFGGKSRDSQVSAVFFKRRFVHSHPSACFFTGRRDQRRKFFLFSEKEVRVDPAPEGRCEEDELHRVFLAVRSLTSLTLAPIFFMKESRSRKRIPLR